MAGLAAMEAEPPPQSESSMFPPLLQPAPQPFCSLRTHAQAVTAQPACGPTTCTAVPVPAADEPGVDVMGADGPSPHGPELTVPPGVRCC